MCRLRERDWLAETQKWGRPMSLGLGQPGRVVRQEAYEAGRAALMKGPESTQMVEKSTDQFPNSVYCQRFQKVECY